MIDHKNKIIFIHIPKTAGTALARALGIQINVKEVGFGKEKLIMDKHETITECLTLNHPCEEYFKFSFVRNPWDRLVSLWSYYHRRSIRPVSDVDFKTFIKDIESITMSVADRYYSNSQRKINLIYPQYHFISDWFGNDILNFIGKFETLQKDFDTVCDKNNIPRKILPHVNKSKHKHYTEYYDDETRQIVAEKYAKDIEYFGYEFGK